MVRKLIFLLSILVLNASLAFANGNCTDLFGAADFSKSPWLNTLDQSRADDLKATIKEFNAEKEEVSLTPKMQIPVVVNGVEEFTKSQNVPKDVKPVKILSLYDLVVAGAGMAGVSAKVTAIFEGLKTMLLEKKAKLGGLAQSTTRAGIPADNGTAYFSPLIPEQEPLYKRLGLHHWEKELPIHDPIDLIQFPPGVKGKHGQELGIVKDPWEPEAIEEVLTAEWALVKWAHFKLNELGEIPNQPIENSKTRFDKMNYEEFLLSTPQMLRDWIKDNPKDKEAKALWARLKKEMKAGLIDPNLTATHRGIVDRVIRYYIINYMHSALGGMPNEVNAAAALNFVYSEMVTRYTTPIGTNEIVKRSELLMHFNKLSTVNKEAYVESMEDLPNGVRTTYVKDGVRYQVDSKEAIFSLPLNLAPKIIKDFERIAPEHNRIIKEYVDNGQVTDYVVSVVYLKGEPSAVKLAYDAWLGRHEFDTKLPTDAISAKWQQRHGYKDGGGLDRVSALTLYHPIGKSRKHTRQEMLDLIEADIQFIKDRYDAALVANKEQPLEVRFAEVNLWPASILVPRVNHFENAKILAQPVGRHIRFAISGWMGTPSHEEAQYRGWRAAMEVVEALKARVKTLFAKTKE